MSFNLVHSQFLGISKGISSSVISGRGFSFLITFSLTNLSFSACILFKSSLAGSSFHFAVQVSLLLPNQELSYLMFQGIFIFKNCIKVFKYKFYHNYSPFNKISSSCFNFSFISVFFHNFFCIHLR